MKRLLLTTLLSTSPLSLVHSNAFECVLDFIEKARDMFEVEVTAVALPEVDVLKIEKIARRMNVKFRLREYIQGFW